MAEIDKAIYWELRTKIAEHQARVKEFEMALSLLLTRAGLVPGTDYRLDDATCSATPVMPPPPTSSGDS